MIQGCTYFLLSFVSGVIWSVFKMYIGLEIESHHMSEDVLWLFCHIFDLVLYCYFIGYLKIQLENEIEPDEIEMTPSTINNDINVFQQQTMP